MVKQCNAQKDVPTKLRKEEYLCIRHGGRYPAKNEHTKPSRKEYVQGTLQSSNDVVMEDVSSRSIRVCLDRS